MTRTLLSLGHGYTARFLSRLLCSEGGWRVIGTTRSERGIAAIEQSGAEARIWPGSDLAADISVATHILVSIAPDPDGDPVLRSFSNILASATRLDWVGYLSTTSVYGNRNGGWVDEDSELLPTTERGKLRVEAERRWQELAAESGLPLHLFRLAGIYGPARGPLHKLLGGRKVRVVRSGQHFNRIHVADIARILCASMDKPESGAIYNVCDDLPARSEDVMKFAARLAGVPAPATVEFAEAELSGMSKSFYSESKRVRNRRLKSSLAPKLQFPDYEAGLTALKQELDGMKGGSATGPPVK